MYRGIFSKEGNAIWISHLDLMRVLQRSFRRAGLLLKHSQGFTPHPALSLALPLSVGVSSCCEVMDFELAEGQQVNAADLAGMLNPVLPEGIRIQEIYETIRKARELTHLRVAITLEYDEGVKPDCEQLLAELFKRDELLIEKKTKSGNIVTQNILEMMKDVSIAAVDGCTLRLEAVICAQNPSLNPSVIATVICRELPEYTPDFSSIRRLAVLDGEGAPFR